MIQSRSVFPIYDLEQLLSARGGLVEGELIDAGMVRPFSGSYRHAVDGEMLRISPAAGTRQRGVVMPRHIPLTPELLGFLGMYSGDGNKTRTIGFAQRNVRLLETACRGLRLIFGQSVTFSINLLNDSRYFMRPEFSLLLAKEGLTAEALLALPASRVPQALRDRLTSEFREEANRYLNLRSITAISTTISPLKGARDPGAESREYIVSLIDSRWLLPLLLMIIAQLNRSLSENTQVTAVTDRVVLDWSAPPAQVSYFQVDVARYIDEHQGCRWYTNAGQLTRYSYRMKGEQLVVGGTSPFVLPPRVTLGPITSYAAGLYFAEGTSDKDALLSFDSADSRGLTLALSFNSSENTSLALFLASLVECLGGVRDVVRSWKVKVGSQYMYEMQVLGELVQSPMIRQGPKGQGVSRSCVHAGFAREWAVEEFPALAEARDLFSHIEYTGAGIARVQVTCGSTPARLLFSFYRVSVGTLIPGTNGGRV